MSFGQFISNTVIPLGLICIVIYYILCLFGWFDQTCDAGYENIDGECLILCESGKLRSGKTCTIKDAAGNKGAAVVTPGGKILPVVGVIKDPSIPVPIVVVDPAKAITVTPAAVTPAVVTSSGIVTPAGVTPTVVVPAVVPAVVPPFAPPYAITLNGFITPTGVVPVIANRS